MLTIIIDTMIYQVFLSDMPKLTIGETRLETAEIYLSQTLSLDPLLHTLMHECLHIILEHTGHIKAAQDEGLIAALTSQFVALLRSNPLLLDWMLGKSIPAFEKKEFVADDHTTTAS